MTLLKMASRHGVRALLGIPHSMALQHGLGIITLQLTSTHRLGRLCSSDSERSEPKPVVRSENVSLLENLNQMGVDVNMVRRRLPEVLRKKLTNERELAQFLQSKGATCKEIASVITRCPRAITRSMEHLDQCWELLGKIFPGDREIVEVLHRSPHPFFRTRDNTNLEENIAFLTSLEMDTKALYRLLATAPRTFSNSMELNRKMLECLEDICAELGGEDPQQFSNDIMTRNVYIFTHSTKRVKTNINFLRTSLELSDSELLGFLRGRATGILTVSNRYLKRNWNTLQQKMLSHGCQKAELEKLITTNPYVLHFMPDKLKTKLDCLLTGGITFKQILKSAKVLDYSTKNIERRLKELQRVGYDFEKNGISLLDYSQKRFDARMEKLR